MLSGRGPDDFHQVRFAEVEGHGSGVGFFRSPGLYKGEPNGARGSLEGSENRTEFEAVNRGKAVRGSQGPVWRGRTNRTELKSELRGEKSESW